MGAVLAMLPVIAAILLARKRPALLPAFVGLAIGVSSLSWFVLLPTGLTVSMMKAVDTGFWIAVLVFAAWTGRFNSSPGNETVTRDRYAWFAIAVFLLLAIAGTVGFIASSAVQPHGEWDAWAQWNLRARFLFRGVGGDWRNAYAPVLQWSHPDYPLLVSAAVARAWSYIGHDTVAVPIAIAGLFAAATVATIVLSLAPIAGLTRAMLAGAALLACPGFVHYAPWQCADIPLAFFIVASFALLSRALPDRRSHTAWLAAGATAALAGWTKNEGLAFMGIFLSASAVAAAWCRGRESWRAIGALAAGAAPILAVIATFKIAIAPASYYAGQSLGHAVHSLMDAGRVAVVVRTLGREMWLTGSTVIGVVPVVMAYALAKGGRLSASAIVAATTTTALFIAYVVAYVVTPLDLAWQLDTSAGRVATQLVPAVVWTAFAWGRNPTPG